LVFPVFFVIGKTEGGGKCLICGVGDYQYIVIIFIGSFSNIGGALFLNKLVLVY